jgi:hypothetical protein
MMKSAPKQEINLADHVVDEVPVLDDEQHAFIKNQLMPALTIWENEHVHEM